MSVQLDHTIVFARERRKAAALIAAILDVPWAESGVGPFCPVYVNDGLTLDFIDTDEAFPIYHFCFRVGPDHFEAILGRIRAAGIAFRSDVHGPVDMKVHPEWGNVYWNEPDGHQWEMLVESYARAPE